MLASSLDGRLAVWIATHRYAPLNDVFVWLGTIDKLGAVWVALAVLVALLQRRRIAVAVGLVALTALTTFAADSVSFAIKDLVRRTRPFVAHPEIRPLSIVHSSSFPAGHAATAFAGATLLAFLAPRATPLFATLAVAIGFSRVYVGVHYPGDVLAGAAIGFTVAAAAMLLVVCIRGDRRLTRTRRHPWSKKNRWPELLAHAKKSDVLENG
jgi:undecaprenyl-diphosphatase